MIKDAKSASVALGETMRMALDTLRAHKLRSFLTLLGVILAVATLVAVVSVVEGLNRYVSDRVANLGANVFLLDRFGIITSFEDFVKAQRRPVLTPEDYEGLKDRLQLAQQVAALDGTDLDVRYGNELFENARVQGVTPNFAEVRSLGVAAGRFLTEADDLHRSPVCFLGNDLVEKFFPHVDPIGKSIRAGTHVFEVVGVATPVGSIFGVTQDNFVLVPFGTFEKTWHTPRSSLTIFVQAHGAELMEAAQDEARLVMRARRHVPYDASDNFGIIAPSSITGLWQELTGNIFALAVWLTAVFLVVGGVVIMNIMLASVTERTREIGIRKSLGARRRHIIMQFLVEAAALAALGGFVGILLALGIEQVVRALTPMPISTPARAIILGLLLSTSVGLFFGIYPAVRASRLDPIEALRTEV
ncbi:MAG TPA: ABC transporter permease [Candidatus Acidoferrales bacterium]|nr:ABC transporter permease [Candidatus Acidoferrales bacterium]